MKKLLLIDANSLIHRMFHALPPLSSEGKPSNAIFGVANILLKVIREQNPNYIAAAFDRPETTFRKEMFAAYKITRPPTPPQLVTQIIEAHNLFSAFNIKTFEMPGFEADDIIGSLVKKLKDNLLKIIILTGDLDTLQLVEDDKVIVETLKKGVSETVIYNEEKVKERYNLPPSLIVDYKALVGDKSDNIPGIKNVGPKTAQQLLQKYDSLENIIEKGNLQDKCVDKIQKEKEIALLSKKLAKIETDISLDVQLEELTLKIDEEKLKNYFLSWGFNSLIKRLIKTEDTNDQQSLISWESQENSKVINSFFIKNVSDLTPSKILSKNIKIAWDWKEIIKTLLREKKQIPNNIFDLKIAVWLLNPDEKNFSKEYIVKKILNKEHYEENDWKNLFIILKSKLEKNNLYKIFEQIEMPLIEVLASLEINGIKINYTYLRNLTKKLEVEIEEKKQAIFNLAGSQFNINSPKQVADVFFKKLNLKIPKKILAKSGKFSTSFQVLSKSKGEPLVDLLLEYRELFKIYSTYLKPLFEMMDSNFRIHTSYNQTGTATGRLSSFKPNLQNIPQEPALSKEIRKIFEAEENFSLVSFDYSQLELRLLASITQDENLINAFKNDADIHTLTASKILNLPPQQITKEQRRLGKTLNFGIVYGMGARAFSENAQIPLQTASQFIDQYFKNFPKIKEWQNKIKESVFQNNFVENINGRKRWFFNFENPKIKAQNERAAINMPIQSLGADILKKSMIESYNLIKKQNLLERVKMVLTIHDELIFEIQDDILKTIIPQIKLLMEKSQNLNVPLKVDVKCGKNLGDLKNYEIN